MKKFITITIILVILLIIAYIVFKINQEESKNSSDVSSSNQSELKIENYNLFSTNDIDISELEKINNIYYKKISNYEDYQIYKSKYAGMLDMEAEDFENNFMIITFTENISTSYLVPHKIDVKDNTLYVGMLKNVEENKNNALSSIILPKKADMENTIVYQCIDFTFPTDKYVDITSLPEEYSLEQAQKDNCYISASNGHVYNENILNSFLDAVNNNENYFIRIIRYSSDNQTVIIDVYFDSKIKKFYVCQDSTRAFPKTAYNYYTFTSLEKKGVNFLNNNRPVYYLADETQYEFPLYTD